MGAAAVRALVVAREVVKVAVPARAVAAAMRAAVAKAAVTVGGMAAAQERVAREVAQAEAKAVGPVVETGAATAVEKVAVMVAGKVAAMEVANAERATQPSDAPRLACSAAHSLRCAGEWFWGVSVLGAIRP